MRKWFNNYNDATLGQQHELFNAAINTFERLMMTEISLEKNQDTSNI